MALRSGKTLQHQKDSVEMLISPEKSYAGLQIAHRIGSVQKKMRKNRDYLDSGCRRRATLQPKHLVGLPDVEHTIVAQNVVRPERRSIQHCFFHSCCTLRPRPLQPPLFRGL